MSDLVIRSGGVVEVDTEALRCVARTLERYAHELDELRERASAVTEGVAGVSATAGGVRWEAMMLRSAIETAAREAHEVAEGVTRSAALYEAVELEIARDAARAAGDDRRADLLAARLARLAASDPLSVAAARRALDDVHGPHRELYAQAYSGSQVLGPSALWLAFPLVFDIVDRLGRGAPPASSRLRGPEVPVALRSTPTGVASPPATLAAAASRMPTGEARVRVERYTAPSGAYRYLVYAAGTSSAGGAAQAFDMRSNLQLYAGERSASYTAVASALREAGARPGDVVHGFGHSQGAMVLERLALEGEYEMPTLVSFGSPVQADVGSETLSVTVRHTDDPVPALQSGGHPGVVGSPDSFVVERVADPPAGLEDLQVSAHQMTAYAETAAMVDGSTDPRVDALRDVFAGWEKEEGEGWDYVASRISPARGAGEG